MNEKNEIRKKSFLARMIEKLDRKIQEKAKSAPCCCKPNNKENKSCCS